MDSSTSYFLLPCISVKVGDILLKCIINYKGDTIMTQHTDVVTEILHNVDPATASTFKYPDGTSVVDYKPPEPKITMELLNDLTVESASECCGMGDYATRYYFGSKTQSPYWGLGKKQMELIIELAKKGLQQCSNY